MAPVSLRQARRPSRAARPCTSAVRRPTRRAISPGCGVRTVARPRRSAREARVARSPGARAFRPSASTTSGTRAAGARTSRTKRAGARAPARGRARARRRRALPPARGPRSRAAAVEAPPAVEAERLRHHLGAQPAATAASAGSGVAIVTRPDARAQAPRRGQDRRARLPDRARRRQHVAERRPCGRPGRAAGRPAPRRRPRSGTGAALAARGTLAGMPMSATTSSPTRSQAGGSTWPSFGGGEGDGQRRRAPSASGTSPVSEGTPGGKVDRHDRNAALGRAARSRRSRLGPEPASAPGRGPVPRSASIDAGRPRSSSARDRAHAAASATSLEPVPPARSKAREVGARVARARPSRAPRRTAVAPAVAEAPRHHEAVAAVVALAAEDDGTARPGVAARARPRATAAPAFSMSTAPGRPISSMVAAVGRAASRRRSGPGSSDDSSAGARTDQDDAPDEDREGEAIVDEGPVVARPDVGEEEADGEEARRPPAASIPTTITDGIAARREELRHLVRARRRR